MEYVEGDNLSKVWLSFPEDQKLDIARQLLDILKAMRSIEPPEGTARRSGRVMEAQYEIPEAILLTPHHPARTKRNSTTTLYQVLYQLPHRYCVLPS
jgi:hypothetical protein